MRSREQINQTERKTNTARYNKRTYSINYYYTDVKMKVYIVSLGLMEMVVESRTQEELKPPSFLTFTRVLLLLSMLNHSYVPLKNRSVGACVSCIRPVHCWCLWRHLSLALSVCLPLSPQQNCPSSAMKCFADELKVLIEEGVTIPGIRSFRFNIKLAKLASQLNRVRSESEKQTYSLWDLSRWVEEGEHFKFTQAI